MPIFTRNWIDMCIYIYWYVYPYGLDIGPGLPDKDPIHDGIYVYMCMLRYTYAYI
jgi:hypothetical protein